MGAAQRSAAGTSSDPSVQVDRVGTADLAVRLGRRLTAGDRRLPVVVVSTASGRRDPYVPAEDIARHVSGLAEVVVLEGPQASSALSGVLPHGAQVYGGASRVYPPGWQPGAPRPPGPIRFAFSPVEGARVVDQLISDALTFAHAAGADRRAGAGSRPATGTVVGVAGGRALVDVDGGGVWPAVVWPELIAPHADVEHLLSRGMAVTGVLDTALNRLDVSGLVDPDEALSPYRVGDVVLAKVGHVERGHVKLLLLPHFPVVVQAFEAAGSAAADLRTMLSTGETVTAVVIRVGGGVARDWALRLTEDAAVCSIRPAPAALPGGPAWLTVPVGADLDGANEPDGASEPDDALDPTEPVGPVAAAPADVVPAPRPPVDDTVQDLVRDLHELRALAHGLQQRYDRSQEREKVLKREVRTATTRAHDLQDELDRLHDKVGPLNDVVFGDAEEQFRFEVYTAWAYRTTAQEKETLRLRDYTFSPGFLDTLSLTGVDRAKVVAVVVDVLTDRVFQVNGRQAHQLRQGPGGEDAPVVGPAGATCWRIYLQHKAPQARRLHFWSLADGRVELSAVRLHDDHTP